MKPIKHETVTPRLWATEEAAEWLGLSKAYLELLRCKGGGPRFMKLGRRVVYRQTDLDAWVEEHAQTSTSSKAS